MGVAVDRGVLLWRVPFAEWNENIVTPIVSGNRVTVTGVRQGTIALDVTHAAATRGKPPNLAQQDVTM